MQEENFCIGDFIQVSNFPFQWWDKTITIYNKLIDPTTQKVSWYRNTVENCFWKYINNTYVTGNSGMSTTGVLVEVKNVICRIPKDDRYVDKRTWKDLSESQRAECFTLGNGDIIVLGEVNDEIDEYTAGKRSTDLLKKYKEFNECFEIDGYTVNVNTGVGLEHYKVSGK